MHKFRVAKVSNATGEVWRDGPLFASKAVADSVAQMLAADGNVYQVESVPSLADYIKAGDKEGAAKKLAEVRTWIAEDMQSFAAEVD